MRWPARLGAGVTSPQVGITMEFQREIERSGERIRDGIAPYSRFIPHSPRVVRQG
jgi:hypothetical protein